MAEQEQPNSYKPSEGIKQYNPCRSCPKSSTGYDCGCQGRETYNKLLESEAENQRLEDEIEQFRNDWASDRSIYRTETKNSKAENQRLRDALESIVKRESHFYMQMFGPPKNGLTETGQIAKNALKESSAENAILETENQRLRELIREARRFIPVEYPTAENPGASSLRDRIIDALKEAKPNG